MINNLIGQHHTIVLISALILIALIATKISSQKKALPNRYPYQKKTSLFTEAERTFFEALETAIGEGVRIMAKVRLADIVSVNETNTALRQRAFNRIQAKHLDFVICHPKTLNVLFVIELDDGTHRRRDRKTRDDFLNRVMASAGIPIVRYPVRHSYTPAHINNSIAMQLEGLK